MRIAWTDEQILTMLEMRDSGMTCEAIGKKLGTSKGAIVGMTGRIREAMKDTPFDKHDDTMPNGWWKREKNTLTSG